jgi:predicted metal-dependent hydrolase
MTRFALAAIARKIGAVQNTARQIPLFPVDDAPPARPGAPDDVVIRESSRARRLSIKVYPRGRVEVVVPRRTRPADVASFVSENRTWIENARKSFAHRHPTESSELPGRILLRAIDRTFRVQYRHEPGATSVRYRHAGQLLTLSGKTSDRKLCIAAIKRWLSGIARSEFAPLLRAQSLRLGISYEQMHIRAQRSCWGSRSSSGTISLNLCLLFLRPDLLRYLMVHELCHGRHMNHSRRFWKLVGEFESEYRQLDNELTECWQEVPAWLGLY